MLVVVTLSTVGWLFWCLHGLPNALLQVQCWVGGAAADGAAGLMYTALQCGCTADSRTLRGMVLQHPGALLWCPKQCHTGRVTQWQWRR
jgi:hypothetical protein